MRALFCSGRPALRSLLEPDVRVVCQRPGSGRPALRSLLELAFVQGALVRGSGRPALRSLLEHLDGVVLDEPVPVGPRCDLC